MMKKSLLVFLSALLLISTTCFTACDSWMQDDDFYDDIEHDVKVANAKTVSVYVRYANSKMGTTEPSGYKTLKEDIPANLTAVTSDDYGFVRWAAFSTNDFSTSSQHSDLFYDSAEKYAEIFQPLELSSSEVLFSDPTKSSTKVTLKTTRSDIFITPLVAKRPNVVTSVPSNGQTNVVKNSQIRILFSKPIDESTLVDEFGNSNIQVTSGRAVLTENSDDLDALDITSHYNIKLSKTKKMLTISAKKGADGKAFLFDGNSQISVNIFEDVCDVDGYKMNGNYKFSFTTGTKEDSLAPFIDKLSAGIGEDCMSFQQYKFDESENHTQKAENATNIISDYVKADASLPEGKKLLKQRVKDKINIYVRATDIAGSGGNIDKSDPKVLSESDVALIQIRASLYADKDGNPVTTSAKAFKDNSSGTDSSSVLAVREFGYSMGAKDSDCQIKTNFEEIKDEKNNNLSSGTLFTYDLSSLDDGLIKIDLWAVDMVGMSGDSESYSATYDNGYRSIFVVKDTTKPDAEANKSNVKPDLTAAANGNWFNETTYNSIKIQPNTAGNTDSLKDAGHPALVCEHDNLKWIVKPTTDTNWVKTISKDDSAWKPVTEEYKGFTKPSSDGPVTLTYALMDDLGNISDAVAIEAFNYDATLPRFDNLSWTADSGSTEGIAKENELNTQTLVIPLKEITAGLKTVELTVAKGGLSNPAYGNPFDGTGLSVKAGETTLTKGTHYTVSGNKLTFKTAQTDFNTNLTIKGIKISNETSAAGLEGNYTIQVKATDAANNSTTTSIAQDTSVSIDSTSPAVKEIYIPNIKKAVRFEDSNNTPEYWIDYTSLNNTYTNPRTDIYVTFDESNSGAKVFDLTGSYINFTSASKLYKYDTTINEYSASEIPATVDTSKGTLTINDFRNAVKNPAAGLNAKVKITNVEITANKNAKANLKIADTATNLPAAAFATIKSKDGDNEVTGISEFSYDNESITASSYTLTDKETETNCAAAEDGYTNNAHINAKITLGTTTKASGVYSITIDGPAEFDSTTTIKNSSGDSLTFDISDDKKTATFYKEVSGVKTHMLFNNAASSGKDVNISNLKLTGGEGSKSITLKAGHLSGVVNSGETQTIVLDTTPPAWVGKGLYTGVYSGSVAPAYVYPHPTSDGSSEGLTLPGRSDLYFYRSSSMRIDAKVTEQYPRLDDSNKTLIKWTGPGLSGGVDYAYMYGTYTGDFTANVYDKAGNKSEEIAFHIEYVNSLITSDDSRKDIKTNLENEVQLIVPEGADLQKNTFLNGVRSPEGPRTTDFDFASSQAAKIWVFNYVLKKFDGNYQLKVPVHNYAAGGTKTVPIEQYGVSHQYGAYPSDTTDCDGDAFIPKTPNWHDYKKDTSLITDGHLSSKVDENGDVIIILPNHNCPPVSLWLKDACGNTEFILLNPGLKDKLGTLTVCTSRPIDDQGYGKRNQAVAYVIDNRVGVNDSHNGTDSNEEKTYPTNTLVSKSDISFYKKNSSNELPELKLNALSDSCRFPYVSNYNGLADLVNNSSDYSLKSKIIVWQGSGKPAYEKFYDSNIFGSDWYGWKEFYDASGAGSAFTLKNNFPEFDNAVHDTNKYELWYIIEDRVGNYEVRPLKNGSKTDWLYDVTPPKLDVKEATNVNNVEGKNYYSNSSSVKYSIEDKQSGIQNNGASAYDYSSFASRIQLYPQTGYTNYQLNGVKPKDSNGEEVANETPGTIAISGVKDWAENEVSSVGLENAGSNIWIYQPNAPAFASSSPVQITAINPPSGKKFETGSSSGEWYINSSRKITHIQLKMTMADSEPLLGWIINSDDSAPENKIYTVADTQSQNGNPAVLTPIPHSGKVYTYSIDKTKKSGDQVVDDTATTWNNYFNKKPLKFYAVNRAGIINTTPIVINFKEVPVPELNGNLEYSDVIKYPSSSSTDNYIKSASKVIFKTKENPDECTIFVGTEAVTFTLSEYLNTSTGKYEIPLGTDNKLKVASGAALKLVLSITNGEDSGEIELKGPANKNKWTFDETAPSISVASVKTIKQGGNTDALTNLFDSSDKTYYIEGDKAVITFDTSDTDIAKWEQKLSTEADSAYKDIAWTSDKTITLDVNKTYNFRAIDKAGNISAVQTVALKKDVSAPDGSAFTYKLKKGDDKTEADYYTDSNGTIVYNTSKVDSIELILTGVNDPDGNGLHFFSKLGENAAGKFNPNVSNGVKTYKITLNSTNNYNAKYVISVKDNLGHETILKSFDFTADTSTPTISISAVQSQRENYTVYDGYLNDGVYYLCRDDAIITFTSTATDIKAYQVKSADGTSWITVSDGNVHRFNCTAITLATTYTFRAVDNVGHASSELSCKLVYDGAGPEGSLTQKLYKDSTEKTAFDSSANPLVPGDYTLSTDENQIITVTYNSNNVNKIVFADDSVTDSLSGYTAGSLFYKKGSGQETALTGNALELTADMGTDVYEIIAKDNAGNKTTIAKYKFVADVTGPEITSGVTPVSWHDRNVKQVNGYTSTMGLIPYAKWVIVDDRQRVSCYTSGTKLMFAKTAISDAIQYQLVQTQTIGNTDKTDGYTAKAGNDWQSMVVSDDGNNFVFALPDIHTPYTRLSLFFRDELGNVSDPYYLGNNNEGQHGIQWWITGAAVTAGDIKTKSITWNDNGTVKEGWGGKLHDYIVTLELPVGTLVKSVFLSPKPGEANTGVVFSTSLPTDITNALQFSGYTNETDGMKNTYDKEGFIVLPSAAGSETGTITMVIYPHDVEDDNKVNILVKFNVENADADGVSKQLFKADGTINASMHSGFLGKIISAFGADQKDQGTVLSGQTSSSDTSANSGWFRNIISSPASFGKSSALTAGTAGSTSKKAAKAAKKASKKVRKNKAAASRTAPVVEFVQSESIENTIIPEAVTPVVEWERSDRIEANTITAESAAQVVESVTPVVGVSRSDSIENTAATADSASDKHSSTSAIIVVMLAVLSSAGGAWYILKARKRK